MNQNEYGMRMMIDLWMGTKRYVHIHSFFGIQINNNRMLMGGM